MIQKTYQTLLALVIIIAFLSCTNSKKRNQQDQNNTDQQEETQPTSQEPIKRCNTMEVLEKHLAKRPDLRSKMDNIEKHCEAFIEMRKSGRINVLDTINIPTVVHIIYNNDKENISEEQIQSQIDVLNEDFNKKNTDISQIPKEFSDRSSSVNLRFSLDSVIRISSTKTSWGTDDEMKFSSSGGSDVISPNTRLNIWVCNIDGGVLGYAQFPGDNPDTDGIVVSPQYFGTSGSAIAPFDKGRTTTHEVGHWLNLRHIWGDGGCLQDDFVADTPESNTPNYGCPDYPVVNCESNDMTMNYMDYVDDACMYMFTSGQTDRMRAVFASGGPREGFLNSL
ncbi:zinc metalloprotease [Aquimarina algicola]|uniref:Zinc metalloprotease n=1 Tax=Aquimarina algicola TaxID=2589995 RepID=A0A504JJ68_9FLAO|nr:zinc metalloprotease [Aquimarina algicola]TPN87663.1 zinc metalloprotease [Aquimarina algicola]